MNVCLTSVLTGRTVLYIIKEIVNQDRNKNHCLYCVLKRRKDVFVMKDERCTKTVKLQKKKISLESKRLTVLLRTAEK